MVVKVQYLDTKGDKEELRERIRMRMTCKYCEGSAAVVYVFDGILSPLFSSPSTYLS